ncbi:alcohol dehydrogenase GroES-like domain-containing protein [Ascobolus immersus RN42]|uniref:alcohol dehydrogenase (NADP(+)) n=1 Tax=Ascobolus immersus RN42 TaxID=1160509 RepID=A0A3N4HVH3_ASCIM|nr:alcohol dehydrogenase GroES-like domain-containing protein [Ascobolus immersus RN42]
MSVPEKFKGFFVEDSEHWSDFKLKEHTPKPFGPHDVDIKIHACGVCGSDVHCISGGWGQQNFPLCVGHEIIGTAVRVGEKVTLIKEGQRVGVGAQIGSCMECKQCKNGNENYCSKWIDTYGAKYEDGTVSQGGYGSWIRAHEYFTFPIPDGLETENVAPMLCAGITVYSPLVRNGAGPGKKVGVVGLGGLGHYAVMLSKALGAETWVISRSDKKKEDAFALGADGYIATASGPDWDKDHKLSFDIIINTANSSEGFDYAKYLGLMDVHGRWISVGLPEGEATAVSNFTLLTNGVLMGGSHLGNRQEMLDMLDLAAKKGIKGWTQSIKISEEGCKEAVTKLRKGDVRYRYVLTGHDEVFGK